MDLVLLFLGVAIAGAVQADAGQGFRLVAAPVLILTLGCREGIALLVLVGLVFALVRLLGERPAVRLREVTPFLASVLGVVVVGTLLLRLLPAGVAGRVAGVVVLLALVVAARVGFGSRRGVRVVAAVPAHLAALLILGPPHLTEAPMPLTLVATGIGLIAGRYAAPHLPGRALRWIGRFAAAALALALVVAGPLPTDPARATSARRPESVQMSRNVGADGIIPSAPTFRDI